MNQKENLKEKFKQALFSTIKVISDNYKLDKKENKNLGVYERGRQYYRLFLNPSL